jgi:hypothetical protein
MKCYDCGGELTSPQGVTLRICPFCDFDSSTVNQNAHNRPEAILHEQVKINGQALYRDRHRLMNLIDNLFVDDVELCKSLRLALNYGVSEKLYEYLSYDLTNQKISIAQITSFFADEYGFEFYRAKEIVHVLALGLGIQEDVLQNRVVNIANNDIESLGMVNERGNMVGNIINYGLVAQQGEWIYYIDNSDGSKNNRYKNKHKLYKIRTNGSGQEKLNDDHCRYINVIGEWIYYCHSSDNLYKIRTDGSGRTVLSDDECSYVNVIGKWIYYCNESDNKRIYKIETDGKNKKRVNNKCSW